MSKSRKAAVQKVMDDLAQHLDVMAHHITSEMVFDRYVDDGLVRTYESMWRSWEALALIRKGLKS